VVIATVATSAAVTSAAALQVEKILCSLQKRQE